MTTQEIQYKTFARLPNGHACVILCLINRELAIVRQLETKEKFKILISELRKLQ